MNVQELFRRLSYGELSNLSIGAEGAGEIIPSQHNKLIYYTNQALLRLYSRFVLREEDLLLRCLDWVTSYHFLKKFAVNSPVHDPEIPPYILDQPGAPFQQDVIKVLTVYDGRGCELPLNDVENCRSLFTPQPNVLQVPNPITDYVLTVIYQARHPKLPDNNLDSCIHLPDVLEEALTAYIAFMVYSNMNGAENAAKAAEHMARYEAICLEVISRDLVSSSSSTTNTKFEKRGFI